VKSAVKSSVKSSTVEPTASEASMKATAVEAASAKAAAVTATTLGPKGVERLRDGHQICWAHVGRSSDGANILIGQQVVAGLRGPSPWLEQQFD